MPTLTGAEYGEDFLYSGCLDLHTEDPAHPCNIWWGQVIYPPLQCDHIPPAPPAQDRNCGDCAGADIVKPVQLARLHTRDIFSFRCRVSVHVSTLLLLYTCPSVYSIRVYSPSVHSTRVLFTLVQVRAGGVAGAAAAG